MSKKKNVDQATIDSITGNLFTALPLLRKRLLHMDAVQGEHGLPLSHIQVLTMLDETGAMSVSEISNRLGIAKPNITPLVDRLVEAGLVDRIRDTQDRRVVNVVIQDAGRDTLNNIRESIGIQVQAWAEDLSSVDFKALADSLQSITRILPLIHNT